jgi:hypothetical protein
MMTVGIKAPPRMPASNTSSLKYFLRKKAAACELQASASRFRRDFDHQRKHDATVRDWNMRNNLVPHILETMPP